MWFLLHFLPTEILSLICFNILLIGLICQVAVIVIPVFPHKSLMHIASIILIMFGMYGVSSADVEKQWREQVTKLKEHIIELDKKSNEVTEKIVTVYVDKVKIVKEKTNELQKQIKTNITEKSNNACKLSNTFVWLHDSAAKNEVPDSSEGIDESPSGIELSTATETIIDNYGKYYEISQQLKSLQDWVLEQQKIYSGEKE